MTTDLNLAQKKILIISQPFGGSELFGQIFNLHKSTFYLEDPLALFQQKSALHKPICLNPKSSKNLKTGEYNYDLQLQALEDIFTVCKLPYSEKFLDRSSIARVGFHQSTFWGECLDSGLCWRHKNMRFTNEKYCKIRTVNKDAECPAIDRDLAYTDCVRSKILAVKSVHICSLEETVENSKLKFNLENNEENGNNLKILYIIRDPRSNFYQRLKAEELHTQEKIDEKLFADLNKCSNLDASIDYIQAKRLSKPGLEKSITILKLEDLLANPRKMIYNIFEKITLEKSVGSNSSSNEISEIIELFEEAKEYLIEEENEWRRNLNKNYLPLFRESCSQFMLKFGYNFD